MLSPGWSSLIMMWSVYRHEDSSRPAKPDENAMPGLAPAVPPGLDPVELVVDAERFVVTRRADSPGTYHFDWISQPASYGSAWESRSARSHGQSRPEPAEWSRLRGRGRPPEGRRRTCERPQAYCHTTSQTASPANGTQSR